MNTKFSKGDEVEVISNGSKGVIVEITSYGSDNNAVYLVDVDGKKKVYTESNLRIIRKFNRALNLDVGEMSMSFQLEDKISSIIEKLNLTKPDSDESQLITAAKLHMYLATSDDFDEDTKNNIIFHVKKQENFVNLLENKRDSVVNAYMFSEVLNRVGSNVLNVVLRDENGERYLANLVLIGEDYYYFDVTLEHSVFVENGGQIKNFVLCCGALGKKSYEQFFKPLYIVDFHTRLPESTLPDNVARFDIDIDLVNKLINI